MALHDKCRQVAGRGEALEPLSPLSFESAPNPPNAASGSGMARKKVVCKGRRKKAYPMKVKALLALHVGPM